MGIVKQTCVYVCGLGCVCQPNTLFSSSGVTESVECFFVVLVRH